MVFKPFGESVYENSVYRLLKPNPTVKTKTVYRGCTYVTKPFWKMGKLALIGKFKTLRSNSYVEVVPHRIKLR